MRYLICTLILLCVIATAQAQDTKILDIVKMVPPPVVRHGYEENDYAQVPFTINFEGKERTYQTYAPPDLPLDPRPAIVLLHGSGRTGVSLVEKWRDIANENDIILIGPTAINNWNFKGDGPSFIDAVLEDAKKHYNIDPKRIYLFGHSRGASYALYLSILRSQVFAATAIHAGQFGAPGDAAFVTKAKRKIPLLIINGTKDAIFHIEPVAASAQAFAENGHDAALLILTGHTHWYYDQAPFINMKAWQFLEPYSFN